MSSLAGRWPSIVSNWAFLSLVFARKYERYHEVISEYHIDCFPSIADADVWGHPGLVVYGSGDLAAHGEALYRWWRVRLDGSPAGAFHLFAGAQRGGWRSGADRSEGASVALPDLCRLDSLEPLFHEPDDDALLAFGRVGGYLRGLVDRHVRQFLLEDQRARDRGWRVVGWPDGLRGDPSFEFLVGLYDSLSRGRPVGDVADFPRQAHADAGLCRFHAGIRLHLLVVVMELYLFVYLIKY